MSIVTVPLAGQYGVIADVPAQELPVNAWTSAQNMTFRDGAAERVRGHTAAFTTPSVTPYFIQGYQSTIYRFWVHCGLSNIYVDDGTTRTDITPSSAPTGQVDDRWTGGALNGVLILNNGVNEPVYWLGNVASPAQTLTGWNSAWTCKTLRPLRNYGVALNVTKSGSNYPNMVKWSAAAVPGAVPSSWDETDATKDAGEQDLSGSDPLVDMIPLNNMGVLYKERSMFAMNYIGAPYVWQFQKLPGDIGMLSQGCGVNIPLGHVFLSEGDVMLFDGNNLKSIINARLRRWLFSTIDATNYKRSFVTTNPSKNEVWVCFPQSGYSACTLALVWNWIDDTWGYRQLNNVTYGSTGAATYGTVNSWSSDSAAWSTDTSAWSTSDVSQAESRLLLCEATPAINVVDNSTTFAGTNITSILERTGMAFDDPDTVKTITRLRPRIDGTQGQQLSIQFGAQMDAEGSVTWQPPVTYTIGSSYEATSFATGRFLAVRFTSTGGDPWRVRSYDVDVVSQGTY